MSDQPETTSTADDDPIFDEVNDLDSGKERAALAAFVTFLMLIIAIGAIRSAKKSGNSQDDDAS